MPNKEIMQRYFRTRQATENLERVRIGKEEEVNLLPDNCVKFMRKVSGWVIKNSENKKG